MQVEIKFNDWKPQIVCLCGSTRFMDAFRTENVRLTLAGTVVLSVGCDTKSDDQLGITDAQKVELDRLHLKKIEMADYVRMLNVGGYVGTSEAREFAFARWIGKPVTWLEEYPTIGATKQKNTSGAFVYSRELNIGHAPVLTEDSAKRLVEAAEAMKDDPCAVYHFKGNGI